MERAMFLSPMIACTDNDASVTFMEEALGFRLVFASETYRICEKDGLTFHLQQSGDDIGGSAVYLEVDDLDSAWKRAQPHISGLRHREPFLQPYGMREFHLDIPNTNCLLFVGQAVHKF